MGVNKNGDGNQIGVDASVSIIATKLFGMQLHLVEVNPANINSPYGDNHKVKELGWSPQFYILDYLGGVD